jgi:hypothetical protein
MSWTAGPLGCYQDSDCPGYGVCRNGQCEFPILGQTTPRQMRKLRRRFNPLYAAQGRPPQAININVKACLGDVIQICKTFTIELPSNCPEGQVICGSSEPGTGTICCDPAYPPPTYGALRFTPSVTPRQIRKAQRRRY